MILQSPRFKIMCQQWNTNIFDYSNTRRRIFNIRLWIFVFFVQICLKFVFGQISLWIWLSGNEYPLFEYKYFISLVQIYIWYFYSVFPKKKIEKIVNVISSLHWCPLIKSSKHFDRFWVRAFYICQSEMCALLWEHYIWAY